jgi:hypothetical protein
VAVKKSRTLKAIFEIQRFLDSEETNVNNIGKRRHWLKDKAELEEIYNTILVSEEEGLNLLRDKIRGFTHYFGSYASDLDRLDILLNSLYKAMMLDIIDLRNNKNRIE